MARRRPARRPARRRSQQPGNPLSGCLSLVLVAVIGIWMWRTLDADNARQARAAKVPTVTNMPEPAAVAAIRKAGLPVAIAYSSPTDHPTRHRNRATCTVPYSPDITDDGEKITRVTITVQCEDPPPPPAPVPPGDSGGDVPLPSKLPDVDWPNHLPDIDVPGIRGI